MDRQGPAAHLSTTATDTPQDVRPAQPHAQLNAAQPGTPGTQTQPDPYAWPAQALAHFTLLDDGTVVDNRTNERYTLTPARQGDANARPVEVKLEDLLGETEDLPLTITREAELAVYGDRQDDYGHPREDFTRTAIIWTGLLHHKLADGTHLEAEDIARCMIGVKLARDVHAPKRDNRVDGAGYFLTLDRLETGR